MEAHDGNLTMQKTQPCDLEKWTFPNHESDGNGAWGRIPAGTRPVSSEDGRIFSPRGERGGPPKWSGTGTGVVFNPRGPVGA